MMDAITEAISIIEMDECTNYRKVNYMPKESRDAHS